MSVPGLRAVLRWYSAARVCIPAGAPAPLHLFAHADLGGGPLVRPWCELNSKLGRPRSDPPFPLKTKLCAFWALAPAGRAALQLDWQHAIGGQ